MSKIEKHSDLLVWQRSRVLVKNIYDATTKFPKSELFGITNQMRRAVVSIPSNIAEGYGRHSNKEFKQFLNIARGSIAELQTQLLLTLDLGYINKSVHKELDDEIVEIYKMLNGLIKKLKTN
jgi:four helix bundle protein